MKQAQAQTPQDTYQAEGISLQIYWNKQQTTNDDGELVYLYSFAQTHSGAGRQRLIEDIIRSQYTIGAEFAAINNQERKPAEYAAYQAFRATAKALADGWLNRDDDA